MNNLKYCEEGKLIVVRDDADDLDYCISTDKPHGVSYKFNTVLMPYITDNFNELQVMDYHEKIKANIRKFNDIIIGLPVLILCQPPQADYGCCVLVNDIEYKRHPANDLGIKINNYWIYVKRYNCSMRFSSGHPELIYIENKLEITDEPYNEQQFFGAIKSYFDDHLSLLINAFKPMKCKSANKLN